MLSQHSVRFLKKLILNSPTFTSCLNRSVTMPVFQQECHILLGILSTTVDKKEILCSYVSSPNDSLFLSLKANTHKQICQQAPLSPDTSLPRASRTPISSLPLFQLFLSTEPFCAFTKKIPRETRDSEAAPGTALPSPARDTATRNKDRSPSLTVREPRQNPTDLNEAKRLLPPAGNTRRKQSPEPRAKHPLPPVLPQARLALGALPDRKSVV